MAGLNIDKDGILEALPHRPPFLLVDSVRDLIIDESCTGLRKISPDEPFFKGHFPNYPIMPGVLIVEALAQTAGVLLYYSLKKKGETAKLSLLTGIEKAKFRRSIFPNDTMELFVKKEQLHGPLWKVSGEAKVNGQTMVTALITAMQINKDKD